MLRSTDFIDLFWNYNHVFPCLHQPLKVEKRREKAEKKDSYSILWHPNLANSTRFWCVTETSGSGGGG